MGLIPRRIYFDSCVVIYLVEEHPTFGPIVELLMATQSRNTDLVVQVSDLTEMECLVRPLRKSNQPLLEKYRQWFEDVDVLPINRQILRRAARLRADFPSLKTPDAIHVATGLFYGCDEFWTNDSRLNTIAPGFAREILIP